MKYVLLLSLALLSCSAPTETPDPVGNKVLYKTSAHYMDVNYCLENGEISGMFNVYKFEIEMIFPPGSQVCISATKLDNKNNIPARVYIYVNDTLVYQESGPNAASVSGRVDM